MEKFFTKAEELTEALKDYADNRIESLKLHTAEKSSLVIANVIAGLAVVVVFLFALGLLSIALSVALNKWLGSSWAGFVVTAGIYLLLAAILWAARGSIIRMPVMNALIKQLFGKAYEED